MKQTSLVFLFSFVLSTLITFYHVHAAALIPLEGPPFLSSSTSSCNRYFTHQGMLPALQRSAFVVPQDSTTDTTGTAAASASIIPYSEYLLLGREIPVTYTNDPKSVYRWFSNHLPYEGCTIGLDVEEVSVSMYVYISIVFIPHS